MNRHHGFGASHGSDMCDQTRGSGQQHRPHQSVAGQALSAAVALAAVALTAVALAARGAETEEAAAAEEEEAAALDAAEAEAALDTAALDADAAAPAGGAPPAPCESSSSPPGVAGVGGTVEACRGGAVAQPLSPSSSSDQSVTSAGVCGGSCDGLDVEDAAAAPAGRNSLATSDSAQAEELEPPGPSGVPASETLAAWSTSLSKLSARPAMLPMVSITPMLLAMSAASSARRRTAESRFMISFCYFGPFAFAASSGVVGGVSRCGCRQGGGKI